MGVHYVLAVDTHACAYFDDALDAGLRPSAAFHSPCKTSEQSRCGCHDLVSEVRCMCQVELGHFSCKESGQSEDEGCVCPNLAALHENPEPYKQANRWKDGVPP